VSAHLIGWVGAAAREDAFDDDALLGAMLRFEVALAQAQGALGLIPAAAAAAIARHAPGFCADHEAMARAGALAGSPAIPFVQSLTRHIASQDPGAADFVHHGVTSQDLIDSALALCAQTEVAHLQAQLRIACDAAQGLARAHAATPMLARTLLQPAGVTTAGFKCAQWAQALARVRQRVLDSARGALAVSLGGAIGNLAAHGEAGPALRAALAGRLGLSDPGFTWHVWRDAWIALPTAVALAAATMRKIALDIALMAQAEVGEAAEPAAAGRGGSTAMPHKRNPVLSMRVLAATQPVPGHLANLLASMAHEHDRALGNWQAEAGEFAAVFGHAHAAAAALAELLAGLTIDQARCRHNIDATRGSVFSEALAALLVPAVGKRAGQALVSELADQVRQREGATLRAVALEQLRADPRLASVSPASVEAVFDVNRATQASARQVAPMLAAIGD
jgi:3-carboxy-cis,cis-muconate cycloisomerase